VEPPSLRKTTLSLDAFPLFPAVVSRIEWPLKRACRSPLGRCWPVEKSPSFKQKAGERSKEIVLSSCAHEFVL
jgi:hypothetical protein